MKKGKNKHRILSFTISIVATSAALVHLLLPTIVIDTVTISLLIIAALPWLAPIIKSVTLPNGVTVELQDWQEAVENIKNERPNISETGRVDEATSNNFMPIATSKESIERIESIDAHDSNTLLISIRIELEKKLRDFYNLVYNTEKTPSTYFLLNNLTNDGFISKKMSSGLKEIIKIGNMVSHGASVDPLVSVWIESEATDLLSSFDSIPFLVEALFEFDETKVMNEARFPPLKRYTEYIKHGKNRLGRWFVAKRDPNNGDVSVVLFQ